MKQVSAVPARWLEQYAALRQSLVNIGYISAGSVVDRTTLKTPRAGYQWTRKVGRKTVTVALSAEQFAGLQQAIQNGRRVRKTIRAMEVLSRQILFAATTDTRRIKPFKKKDLRII